MRTDPGELSPEDRELLDDVAARGLHVVHVPARDGRPGCSYSVGLWHSFGQPEVIVFGLEPAVAAALLDRIADAADDGRTLLAGSRHDGLLHGYPAHFLAVPPAAVASWCARAQRAYAGEDFPVVQLVWPDRQGRWPWQPDARPGFRELQPLLAPPP